MSTPVLTVSASMPASDALAEMRDEHVRHAVVVEEGRIAGVVSERDLGGPHGGPIRSRHVVGDLMRADPIVAPPETTVEEAARLLRDRGIGCLPVVEGSELVGLVTRGDVLEALAERRRRARGRREASREPPARPPYVPSPNRDKWP